MLKPNEHGGYIIRQSDLSAWSRCQLQKKYYAEADADPTAPQPRALSATVYGTVVHYALLIMEKLHYAGNENALSVAISTFEKYWDPANIAQIAESIDTWLPRQTYGGLRERGREALDSYYRLLCKDDSKLLALEYQFSVPLPLPDRQHTLTGTIDRISIRKSYGTPYLSIDDFKTGRQPTYLRHHIQGSAYAYASLQPEFWQSQLYPSFDDQTLLSLEGYFAKYQYRLHEGTKTDWWPNLQNVPHLVEDLAARRFRWINLQTIKYADGGWRGEVDYERLRLAVDAYVRANEAEIYSPTLVGEVCVHCPFNHFCGGMGVPSVNHGQPPRRYSATA